MSKRATFQIISIALTCPCGGYCTSKNNGSYTLVIGEEEVGVCDTCGKEVKIPKAAKK